MKHLNVLLPVELLDKLEEYAKASGINKKKIVELALLLYFREVLKNGEPA
jgi:uncharacterized membrane protein (DUF373 family)